jgi:hypothetical protein
MAIARIKLSLASVLGYTTKGIRSDYSGLVCMPSGFPFIMFRPDHVENIAHRQLQGIYPADPARLAALLGCSVAPRACVGYWVLDYKVKGKLVACSEVQRNSAGAVVLADFRPALSLGPVRT